MVLNDRTSMKAPAGWARSLRGTSQRPVRAALRVGLAVAVTMASAAHAGSDAEPSAGAELLAPFKRELKAALMEGLATSPTDAIATCRVKAPEIAASLSREGVRVGRTSHRLRNPANVAPAWAAPILAAYVGDASEHSPRSVELPNDRTGYIEPIFVQPPCLTCHGETLAPAVAARIEALYPDDRAVGFRVGDLRGAFWIEFPTPE